MAQVPLYECLPPKKLKVTQKRKSVTKNESEKKPQVFHKKNGCMQEGGNSDYSHTKRRSIRIRKKVEASAGRSPCCETPDGKLEAEEIFAEMEKVIKNIICPALLNYHLTFDFMKGIYLQVSEKLYKNVEILDITIANFMTKHFTDGLYSKGKIPTEVQIFVTDESDPIIQPLQKMLLYCITFTDGEQCLQMSEFKEECYIFHQDEEPISGSAEVFESPDYSAGSASNSVEDSEKREKEEENSDSPSLDVAIREVLDDPNFDFEPSFYEQNEWTEEELDEYCKSHSRKEHTLAENAENSSSEQTIQSDQEKEPKDVTLELNPSILSETWSLFCHMMLSAYNRQGVNDEEMELPD